MLPYKCYFNSHDFVVFDGWGSSYFFFLDLMFFCLVLYPLQVYHGHNYKGIKGYDVVFYVYDVLWPALCSLKLVINVWKFAWEIKCVQTVWLTLFGEQAELDGSLSLMQADNSTPCGFKHTHARTLTPHHHHHHFESCGHTHIEDSGSFVPSLITLQRALFSLLSFRTRGLLEAMRLCRRMTFIWSKSASIRSGYTSSESSYHPSR